MNMRLRLFDGNETKTKFFTHQDYQSITENNCNEVMQMYQQSLCQSYYQLWKNDNNSFSSDILAHGDNPETAIKNFSEKIAKLTVDEWAEFNLASVIAYENNKIAGFALYGKDNETIKKENVSAWYLYYIGAAPSNFQKGIGTEIMLRMLNVCQSKSVKNEDKLFEMKLHTRLFNTPAIRLYEKFGFNVLPYDITHGHSDKYYCYFNQFDPVLEIKPLKRSTYNFGS